MIQHIEDRKKRLTRIFEKCGITDIKVSAQRLRVEGDPEGSTFQFDDYKQSIGYKSGDVIDLQDFNEWVREQETQLEENGLFLVPGRPLTKNEYERVQPALDRFIARSTSHGIVFEIQSDYDRQVKLRVIRHLSMS